MRRVTRLSAGGRVVIPAGYRRALGLQPGDEVVVSLNDGEVRLTTKQLARQRAQDYVCSLVASGVSLADELIRDREEEAAREEEEMRD